MIVPIVFGSRNTSGLRRTAASLAALLALVTGAASAMNLQQAYDAAVKNDPLYRMNFYENEVGKESRIIGRAGLLPQVSASFNVGRNRVDQTQQQGNREILTHPRYISRSGSIQLRQPLISLESLARYRQGVAQSNQSEANFEHHGDEVALRVVGAYLDVLYANDQLSLVKAQRDAFLEHMKVNTRLFEKGEGTKTDMLEIQARLDLADAQVLESEDTLTAARNTLEGVIGMSVDKLEPLAASFRVVRLSPAGFDDWRAIAVVNNPDLKAARFAIEVQQQEVKRARAGHAPRLDFVATYSDNDSESISTYTQSTVNRSIGLQLNVPIYQGGQVSAVSRQAVASMERAKADLDGRTSKVLVELRKAHSVVVSSVARVDALLKAVDSGTLLLRATEQSIKGGVRINLDLLNAQQQLVTSQRDLAQARYQYLLAVLRLKAAAGTLTGADVSEIAVYFK